jgi:hypothetical protein
VVDEEEEDVEDAKGEDLVVDGVLMICLENLMK